MGPRYLQAQIHADYSTGLSVWSDYRSQIKSMYDLSDSKEDFNDHLIREYNRKIDRLNQETGLYISPFDGGFRFIGDFIFSPLTTITYQDLSVETFDITSIPNDWKVNDTNIASVIIGSKVTSIGDYAFDNCITLTSIIIPNSVTSIGAGAFAECISLIRITIPNSVTSIGGAALQNCVSLNTLNCYVARSIMNASNALLDTASPFTIYARASDSTWTAGTDTIGG